MHISSVFVRCSIRFYYCSQNVATIFYSLHLSDIGFSTRNIFHLVAYTAFFLNTILPHFQISETLPPSQIIFPCSESLFVTFCMVAMDQPVFTTIYF